LILSPGFLALSSSKAIPLVSTNSQRIDHRATRVARYTQPSLPIEFPVDLMIYELHHS